MVLVEVGGGKRRRPDMNWNWSWRGLLPGRARDCSNDTCERPFRPALYAFWAKFTLCLWFPPLCVCTFQMYWGGKGNGWWRETSERGLCLVITEPKTFLVSSVTGNEGNCPSTASEII